MEFICKTVPYLLYSQVLKFTTYYLVENAYFRVTFPDFFRGY